MRESPRFYDEGTFSIYQFRQTLQQTSQSYDCESMVEAEPAIRQLLKLDFEPKVSDTIRRTFRQTINQTINTSAVANGRSNKLMRFCSNTIKHVRIWSKLWRQEAEEKIARNQSFIERS